MGELETAFCTLLVRGEGERFRALENCLFDSLSTILLTLKSVEKSSFGCCGSFPCSPLCEGILGCVTRLSALCSWDLQLLAVVHTQEA